LATALGKLLLVIEQVFFVDCDTASAALRCTAGFDDPTGITVFASTVGSRDFDLLDARLRIFAACEQDADQCDPA
jgi:hypothetical protein